MIGIGITFSVGVALALEQRDEQERAAQQFADELQAATRQSELLVAQAQALEERGEFAKAAQLRAEAAEVVRAALERGGGKAIILDRQGVEAIEPPDEQVLPENPPQP